MDMRNKITDTEYKMLSDYRNWYAWQDEPTANCTKLPIFDILQEWSTAKEDLYKLLGESLILTKELSFNKGFCELRDEMYNALDPCGWQATSARIQREGWRFIKEFSVWVEQTFPVYHYYYWEDNELTEEQEKANEVNYPIKNGLTKLIGYDTLAKNIYDNEKFTIPLPNGKSYVVQPGTKPLKPLAKIADAYNIPYFEDFRIVHSQVHNQKKIKGDLSISIHPLDYWTMSDNDCDWDSCMSWSEYGGYRQGTVEMMNSPCVVVAYLNASEPMSMGPNEAHKWSNKKWRSLFIVDKNVILSIKGYPYENRDLNEVVIKWLKELAETNLGWKYTTNEPQIYKYDKIFKNNGDRFKIRFHSDKMYTDVGSVEHSIYIGKGLDYSVSSNFDKGNGYLCFNYSGASQCVSCGKLNLSGYEGENCLVCSDCEEVYYCSECGERLYSGDEWYMVGDCRYCSDCYNNIINICSECNGEFYDDEVAELQVIIPMTEEVRKYCDATYAHPHYPAYEHCLALSSIMMCNQCIKEFAENHMKPNTSLISYRGPYGNLYYGAFFNDLQEEWLDNFTPYSFSNSVNDGKSYVELAKQYCGSYDHMIIHDVVVEES